jgi:hypothetical protein
VESPMGAGGTTEGRPTRALLAYFFEEGGFACPLPPPPFG